MLLNSIVAVHGLNFLNKPDHAKATWSRSGKLWLSDFLPSRLPKPSRVMLFEYNSSPAIEAAALKLDDHAASLLQWLDIRRKVRQVFGISDGNFVVAKLTKLRRNARIDRSYLSATV